PAPKCALKSGAAEKNEAGKWEGKRGGESSKKTSDPEEEAVLCLVTEERKVMTTFALIFQKYNLKASELTCM
nr:hypothetical protein [Tanacetum cinerariifolium]